MTTIQAALAAGRARLHASPSPALDARLLLQHVLEKDHAYLVAHGDQLLPDGVAAAYDALLGRAAAGEPAPYLTGVAPFYGLDFKVTPAVLIPRPETEQLVERALAWAKGRGRLRIVDVGTGSGCIAVTLAARLPENQVTAVDISAGALAVARENAEACAPGRVHFLQSDLLDAVSPGIDLLAANLPYVTDEEWTGLEVGVKSFEPALALRGGPDGLDLIRRLLSQATSRLHPEGLILLEIGWRQGELARRAAVAYFPAARVTIEPDFAGHDRLVVIEAGQGGLPDSEGQRETIAVDDMTAHSDMGTPRTERLDARDPDAIQTAAEAARRGELVVFPTDTVYGVGGDAFNPEAIDRLYAVKGRPLDKGIPILLADLDDLDKVAASVPDAARALIDRFWPGPLTLVVPRRAGLPDGISPDDTIAVRIPDHPVARSVIRAAGGALATSSANLSGQPAATTGQEAVAYLDGRVALVLDDGPSPGGVSSTVIDCAGPVVRVLRVGPLSAADLDLGEGN